MQDCPIRLEHVTLRYEDSVALDDVCLEVARGERICVLGANGSGKSTLASVICGLLAPDEGRVELLGRTCCTDGTPDLEAYRDARRGLGLVFQNPDDQIVTSVVEDDVAFGPENLGLPQEEIRVRVDRELARVALTDRAKSDPARMSGGQRQRVCIAGALALEPQVLVLDEPAALLDVRGREAIMRVMGRLVAAGTTLVHVTHFMDEALAADRVVVMERGRVALLGTPAEVFCEANAKKIDALGLELPFEMRLSRARTASRPTNCRTADTFFEKNVLESSVCEVMGASYSYGGEKPALDGVSLGIREGEHLAIVGQTGSGKSTLLRLLCGLEAPDAGSVTVAGTSTNTRRGRREARRHVGYVMQHPERQLFAQTVAEDVAFGPRNLGLSASDVATRVEEALFLVGLGEKRDASPFELSGGQRRLAAIAGVLAMRPNLLVMDEPMAGLDPRGRDLLRRVLATLLEQGTTIVTVTHSMDDAARADHVVVLDNARVLFDGMPAEVFSPTNAPRLRACGLGLPQPLEHALALEAQGHAPLGNPLTIEALAATLNATEEESARGL